MDNDYIELTNAINMRDYYTRLLSRCDKHGLKDVKETASKRCAFWADKVMDLQNEYRASLSKSDSASKSDD